MPTSKQNKIPLHRHAAMFFFINVPENFYCAQFHVFYFTINIFTMLFMNTNVRFMPCVSTYVREHFQYIEIEESCWSS